MKILVVDDNSSMTDFQNLSLSSAYEVVTVNTVSEGIELIQQNRPDLVLFDLLLTQSDHWQTFKKLRQSSQVPMIVLSALDHPGLVAEALDAGADDYLIKPVPDRMLTAHIEKLVRRNRHEVDLSAHASG